MVRGGVGSDPQIATEPGTSTTGAAHSLLPPPQGGSWSWSAWTAWRTCRPWPPACLGSTEPDRHGARHLAPYLPGAGSLDERDAELDG